MNIDSPNVEITYLESWLEVFIASYCQSTNTQLLAQICLGVNAIIQHEDFQQLTDRHCSYYKMKNYWLWQWQSTKSRNYAQQNS